MKKREVTIADIAAACQVSVMTVSRALRNDSVKSETRTRIMHTAERMGYYKRSKLGRPGNAAVNASRRYVEIIVGGNRRNSFFIQSELITALERELAEFKIDCLLRGCGPEDYQSTVQLLNSIRNSTAAAAILVGEFRSETLQAILEMMPAVILIDNYFDLPEAPPCASFSFDYTEVGRLATSYFLNCNRHRILILCGNEQHFSGREVELGYRQAMTENTCPIDERLIIRVGYTAQDACEAVKKAIDENLIFDAVFGTDEMIYGARQAVIEKQLRIPLDVALCGCDDMPVNEFLQPRLSSIVLDFAKLARLAVAHFASHDRQLLDECRVRLRPKLNVRESS